MKRIECPCCGYYTQKVRDDAKHPYTCFEICKVCFWQYDEVAHDKPETLIGANGVTLNEAIGNYKKYGVSETRFIGIGYVRSPLQEELPENNK